MIFSPQNAKIESCKFPNYGVYSSARACASSLDGSIYSTAEIKPPNNSDEDARFTPFFQYPWGLECRQNIHYFSNINHQWEKCQVLLDHFGVVVVLWWFVGRLQKCKACLELCKDQSFVWWALVALPLASCMPLFHKRVRWSNWNWTKGASILMCANISSHLLIIITPGASTWGMAFHQQMAAAVTHPMSTSWTITTTGGFWNHIQLKTTGGVFF